MQKEDLLKRLMPNSIEMKSKKYIVDMKINTRPAPPNKPSTVLFGLILEIVEFYQDYFQPDRRQHQL